MRKNILITLFLGLGLLAQAQYRHLNAAANRGSALGSTIQFSLGYASQLGTPLLGEVDWLTLDMTGNTPPFPLESLVGHPSPAFELTFLGCGHEEGYNGGLEMALAGCKNSWTATFVRNPNTHSLYQFDVATWDAQLQMGYRAEIHGRGIVYPTFFAGLTQELRFGGKGTGQRIMGNGSVTDIDGAVSRQGDMPFTYSLGLVGKAGLMFKVSKSFHIGATALYNWCFLNTGTVGDYISTYLRLDPRESGTRPIAANEHTMDHFALMLTLRYSK